MATTETPAAPGARSDARHAWRLLAIWFVLALAADLVIWFVWKPHLPPGDMSSSARHQQFDIGVLAVTGAPVFIGVILYFIYAIVVFRAKPGDDSDGEPIYGNIKVQATWIIGTSAIVLFLAVFGTIELVGPAGAGAGEGPSPIWTLAGKQTTSWSPGTNDVLDVQVIGQQWVWTYRYPQFGGMESSELYLPVNTPVAFHVTSLDVIHSFWAYQLGVKADANPGVDNVAYTKPEHTGGFVVRCSELCGLWHGAMFDYGRVVSMSAFRTWAASTRVQLAAVTRILPPYATTYDPTVVPQINKAMAKAGIGGANGYYYPPQDPVQP